MNASPNKRESSPNVVRNASWLRFVNRARGNWQTSDKVDATLREQIDENRLARVPGYCLISAAGWGTFGCFYFLRNAPASAAICLPIAAMMFGMFVLTLRKSAYSKLCGNLHLALSIGGMTIECLISGLSESSSQLFMCCGVVMAVHQSGYKVGMFWTLLCSSIVVAMHFCLDPTQWPLLRSPNLLDTAVAYAGFFILMMGMASQAEWFSTKYFARLSNKAKELLHLAHHDQLTELANRYAFQIELKEAKEAYRKTGAPFGLLMLDLNSFKLINDTLGHLAGDAVLKELAQRFERAAGDEHTVFRVGGDEFAVVVRSTTMEKLEYVAKKILEELEIPIALGERELPVSISVGAALVPTHTECVDELRAFVDLAAYAAKDSDTSIAFFAPHMMERVTRTQSLVEKLSRAMEEQEFSLVYQPQVSMSSGAIVGVEALMRWDHVVRDADDVGQGEPKMEFISPVEFIPVLESTGQIVPVGKWVLEQACQQVNAWLGRGIECCVSVNVSPVQFQSDGFVQDVLDVLQASRIPPHCLDLEITEGVMVDRLDETQGKLQRLKDAGVKISIDDFGTGYSSLAYLKHLPMDTLKIDRVFVKDIPEVDDGSIAISILSLAHALGLTVVAEGIETEEQLEFLTNAGCETYQGYFFSKPVPSTECTDMLLGQLPVTAVL